MAADAATQQEGDAASSTSLPPQHQDEYSVFARLSGGAGGGSSREAQDAAAAHVAEEEVAEVELTSTGSADAAAAAAAAGAAAAAAAGGASGAGSSAAEGAHRLRGRHGRGSNSSSSSSKTHNPGGGRTRGRSRSSSGNSSDNNRLERKTRRADRNYRNKLRVAKKQPPFPKLRRYLRRWARRPDLAAQLLLTVFLIFMVASLGLRIAAKANVKLQSTPPFLFIAKDTPTSAAEAAAAAAAAEAAAKAREEAATPAAAPLNTHVSLLDEDLDRMLQGIKKKAKGLQRTWKKIPECAKEAAAENFLPPTDGEADDPMAIFKGIASAAFNMTRPPLPESFLEKYKRQQQEKLKEQADADADADTGEGTKTEGRAIGGKNRRGIDRGSAVKGETAGHQQNKDKSKGIDILGRGRYKQAWRKEEKERIAAIKEGNQLDTESGGTGGTPEESLTAEEKALQQQQLAEREKYAVTLLTLWCWLDATHARFEGILKSYAVASARGVSCAVLQIPGRALPTPNSYKNKPGSQLVTYDYVIDNVLSQTDKKDSSKDKQMKHQEKMVIVHQAEDPQPKHVDEEEPEAEEAKIPVDLAKRIIDTVTVFSILEETDASVAAAFQPLLEALSSSSTEQTQQQQQQQQQVKGGEQQQKHQQGQEPSKTDQQQQQEEQEQQPLQQDVLEKVEGDRTVCVEIAGWGSFTFPLDAFKRSEGAVSAYRRAASLCEIDADAWKQNFGVDSMCTELAKLHDKEKEVQSKVLDWKRARRTEWLAANKEESKTDSFLHALYIL